MNKKLMDKSRCGYVAIIGRPNVGKSTLLNNILGQKVSITSKKPQTTRHQLLGIKTTPKCQFLYVDTPGIHGKEPRAINRYMNRSAKTVVRDVDVVVFVLDRTDWQDDDEIASETVRRHKDHLIIAINKVDLLKDKQRLLPYLAQLKEKFPAAELVPISAEQGENVDRLESLIESKLPPGAALFPDDQITDRSTRFLVAEIIREKIMRQLGEEVPYAATIQIESFKDSGKTIHIEAVVFVERDGQKAILIGKKGEKLKRIGTDARQDIETLLERKVMLNIWVKVKANWSDDDRALKSLGYDDV
ncbi:MAG: GTP-binding protein Era [Candidatus Azotimanducaceae bacterium]|jgi:GTP-binding protein Era